MSFSPRDMVPPPYRPYITPEEASSIYVGVPTLVFIVVTVVSLLVTSLTTWTGQWWWWIAVPAASGAFGFVMSRRTMRRVRARMRQEPLP